MPSIRLYSGPLSMFGMKAEIAAREKGIEFDLVMVPYSNEAGYHPRHADILRINPKEQVPVLIHGDIEVFDSTQIFEYLEDLMPKPALWPAAPAARARARLLEHKSDEIYFPHIVRLMSLQGDLGGEAAQAAIGAARAFYAEMESLLPTNEYLAGTYSYADIAFYMASLFGDRMGATMRDETPKLLAWRTRMTQRPAIAAVMCALLKYLKAHHRPIPDFLDRQSD